jgi:hypothetical protein
MGQSNCRWYNRRQVVLFAGNNTLGVCAAGGMQVETGNGSYKIESGGGQVNLVVGTRAAMYA